MELREKSFFIVNLLISCKKTLSREMATEKETKKVELSKNEDLIISPFLFCFVFFFLAWIALFFCFFFGVVFFILLHPRKLWPKLGCKFASFVFLVCVTLFS